MSASEFGPRDVVRVLAEAGANLNLANKVRNIWIIFHVK